MVDDMLRDAVVTGDHIEQEHRPALEMTRVEGRHDPKPIGGIAADRPVEVFDADTWGAVQLQGATQGREPEWDDHTIRRQPIKCRLPVGLAAMSERGIRPGRPDQPVLRRSTSDIVIMAARVTIHRRSTQDTGVHATGRADQRLSVGGFLGTEGFGDEQQRRGLRAVVGRVAVADVVQRAAGTHFRFGVFRLHGAASRQEQER